MKIWSDIVTHGVQLLVRCLLMVTANIFFCFCIFCFSLAIFLVFHKCLINVHFGTALPFCNLGPRILHFGNPQPYANPIVRNMWPAASKAGAESGYDQHRFLYRIDKHRQDKELLLWQDNGPKAGNAANEAMPGTPICQPIRSAIAPSASGKGSRKLPPSDGKPGSFDSGCALYLLSTLQTQSPELSLEQSSITCPMQSSPGAEQFDAVDGKPSGQVLVLDANSTNLHCNGMLQFGPDGLVENGDSLTLPFFWE